MAQEMLTDLTVSEGFMYHKITGKSLEDFRFIFRWVRLRQSLHVIQNLSLLDIREIVSDGVTEESDDMDIALQVERELKDAYFAVAKTQDVDDDIDVDFMEVKEKACYYIEKSMLGLDSETYFTCISCMIWIWECQKKGSDVSYEQFIANTTFGDLENMFSDLIVALMSGDKTASDSPLETQAEE